MAVSHEIPYSVVLGQFLSALLLGAQMPTLCNMDAGLYLPWSVKFTLVFTWHIYSVSLAGDLSRQASSSLVSAILPGLTVSSLVRGNGWNSKQARLSVCGQTLTSLDDGL